MKCSWLHTVIKKSNFISVSTCGEQARVRFAHKYANFGRPPQGANRILNVTSKAACSGVSARATHLTNKSKQHKQRRPGETVQHQTHRQRQVSMRQGATTHTSGRRLRLQCTLQFTLDLCPLRRLVINNECRVSANIKVQLMFRMQQC